MNNFKTLGRVTSSGLFKLSVLLFALLLPIVIVFGKPDTIKETLSSSGIYGAAVDMALDSAQNKAATSSLPLNDPEVRAVIKKAVPPGQLQYWSGQTIDGMYVWLNSDSSNPVINIDLSTAKQKLVTGLGDYVVQRAKTLPICTNLQLLQLKAQGSTVDPFKATCIPRGFNIESLRISVENEVNNNADFLNSISFNSTNLPKNAQGQTPFEQAAPGRTVYKWAKVSPYIWIGTALLFGGLLVLFHDDKRRAAFVIGRTLTAVGLVITLASLVTRYFTTQVTSSTGLLVKQVQGEFQGTIIHVAQDLGSSLSNIYLKIGMVYLAVGVVTLLVLHLTKPQKPTVTLKDLERSNK